ncbi:MAG: ATPase, T2SS/T4P/T4SS family, partial [Candidatus Omnitrophota bacterium]
LYAMLTKARSPDRNIITIEDPVERRIEMVSQIQVNEKAGLTFATALRSIMRHDPDVIMVGEIRDPETAQLAVRAALTGHLVFTTIHTNDAPGVITRLVNMNVEPFLVSSSLTGIIAQRLVRCICAECKEPFIIPDGLGQRLAAAGVTVPQKAWYGKGCKHCHETGYHSRIAVFEMMVMTTELMDMIVANVPTSTLREQARKDGMTSIMEDGLEKVGRGVTTMEEVLRIAVLENVVDMILSEAPRPEKKQPPKEAVISPKESAEEISLDLEDYKNRMTNWLASKA